MIYTGTVTILLHDSSPRFVYKTRMERKVILEYWRRQYPDGLEIQICPDVEYDPEELVGYLPMKETPIDEIAFTRPKAEYNNIDNRGYGIARELHSK